ncbi:MAG: RNA polymerase sigma factor [Candidatus Tectimicrobiota bacterium]
MPSEGPSDFELIDRFLAGERSAFDLLVQRYQRHVYGVAYRITQSVEDAKDLTQETFLQAYRALRGFQRQASFPTWLYRITVHMCFQHRKRRERPQPVAETSETPPEHAQPLMQVLQEEQRQAVAAAIAALPPQQRAALTLRIHQQLSYKDIGVALQCSEGAARANVFHAIQKLRTQLAGFGEES